MSHQRKLKKTLSWPLEKHEVRVAFYDVSLAALDIWRPPRVFAWSASGKAHHGGWIGYSYPLFSLKRFFSIHSGASMGLWSDGRKEIASFSLLLEFRWRLFRIAGFSPVIGYSAGAPSLVTSSQFAGRNLGAHFLFQNYIRFGFELEAKGFWRFDVMFFHYSNLGIFPPNRGFDVPIAFSLAYGF